MVRQGDEDRLDVLERAFVALRSEQTTEMDRRFDQVDAEFRRIDARFDKMEARFDKVDERFERVDEKFERVDARFERIDEKFERMYRMMVTVCASLIGTLIVTCGGLVAAHL